jgi:hypothetical protein
MGPIFSDPHWTDVKHLKLVDTAHQCTRLTMKNAPPHRDFSREYAPQVPLTFELTKSNSSAKLNPLDHGPWLLRKLGNKKLNKIRSWILREN